MLIFSRIVRMTTFIQAVPTSPHALTECQQVPLQSTSSLPSAADLTIAASAFFHFRFEKSNFTERARSTCARSTSA